MSEYVGIAAILLTIAGLLVKITFLLAELRTEVRAARGMIKTIPSLHFRVGTIEKHLELSTPTFPSFSTNEN